MAGSAYGPVNKVALPARPVMEKHKDRAAILADTSITYAKYSGGELFQARDLAVLELADEGAPDPHFTAEGAGVGKYYEAGPNFSTWDRLEHAVVTRRRTWSDDTVLTTPRAQYVWETGATDIAELPNLKSFGADSLDVDLLQSTSIPDTVGFIKVGGGFLEPDDNANPADALHTPFVSNWRPADGRLTSRMIGTTSEIASDFAGRFEQACSDCVVRGWKFGIVPNLDGTPFDFQRIDHTVSNGGHLRLDFDRNAVFYPRVDFQDFLTLGTTGPFTITDWPYDADSGGLSAMLVDSSGVATKLVEDTDFSVSGVQVTLLYTPAAGTTLRVSDRFAAISLRANRTQGTSLYIGGYARLDLRLGGYVQSSASRSGLAVVGFDDAFCDGTIHAFGSPDTNFSSDVLDRRTDSAMVIQNCGRTGVNRIIGDYMNDLVLYATGGALEDDVSDDGGSLSVQEIRGRGSRTGFKQAREGRGAHVGLIQLEECSTGFLHSVTDPGLDPGRQVHIGRMELKKVRRRGVDIRDTTGSVNLGSVSIEDFGFEMDGTTAVSDAAGVFWAEVQGVDIGHLDVRMKEWSAPTGRPAIQVAGENNYGNAIRGGYIDGLDVGVSETGGTSNDVGDRFTLTMKDVANPFATAGLGSSYDITVITEAAGTVTAARLNSDFSGLITDEEPTFLIAGATGSPSFTYVDQDLQYRRAFSFAQFTLRIQATITHAETDKQLRIVLPSDLTASTDGNPVPVVIGRMTGIDLPNADSGAAVVDQVQRVFGEVPDGQSYVRFYYEDQGGTLHNITTDHITSGTSVRIEVAGTVPV